MIGLMPQGLSVDDLNLMFEQDVSTCLEKLQGSYLVELENDTYRVSPFVDQFVDMKVSDDSKKEVFLLLIIFF